jgi:hypothetical protein
MSHMCKLDKKCGETKGMCIHEKMMAVIMMVVILGALEHYVLHWF